MSALERRILSRLRQGSATMRELHAASGRNYSGAAIQAFCAELCGKGEAFEEYVENGRGRPAIRFTLIVKEITRAG